MFKASLSYMRPFLKGERRKREKEGGREGRNGREEKGKKEGHSTGAKMVEVVLVAVTLGHVAKNALKVTVAGGQPEH